MDAPLVSIGLPVFNGEKYLESALDSLLAQDHRNFELIISDNASTDRTRQICLRYADNDKRIRFHRNSSNLGAAANFNLVFRLSGGDYFMWAAHDDIWHPSYISRCLAGLNQRTNVVLCASALQFIDEFGSQVPEAKWRAFLGGGYNRLNTRCLALRERLRRLTKKLNWYAFYGIIRSDVLRRTHLFPTDVFGGDVILLMELLFEGETHILDETLFFYRLLPKPARRESVAEDDSRLNRMGPYTELAVNLLATIDQSRFSPEIKTGLREDLLYNISLNNLVWVDFIQSENPSIARANSPYARSARIREFLTRVSSENPRDSQASPERPPPTAPV